LGSASTQLGAAAITTPFTPALPQSLRTYSDWNDFLSDSRTNVNDYWLHQPFPFAHPYSPPSVGLVLPNEPLPCSFQEPQRTSFYCPTERKIYLDEQSYSRANAWAGYAGLYVMVGHEWTHHVQNLLGMPTEEKVPDFELQADCGSGMFLAAGWPSLPDGDLQAVRSMLAYSPSDSLHGDGAQGLAAFDDGYLRGASTHCRLPLAQVDAPASGG
jgi:predicted metalloprotease